MLVHYHPQQVGCPGFTHKVSRAVLKNGLKNGLIS